MNRRELFQHLIQTNGHHSYLEIGCETDKTYEHVDVPRKVGVDPNRGGTHRMTSDEFFAQNSETFDLVFVDGLHTCEQVLRDVENSLRCLNPGGCIVLHDCLPTAREQQLPAPLRPGVPWTGDVWKAVVELRQRAEFDLAVLGADWGLGVLFVRPNSDRLEPPGELTWDLYAAERVRLLRIVDDDGIKRFIAGEAVKGIAPVRGLAPVVADRAVSEPKIGVETVAARNVGIPASRGLGFPVAERQGYGRRGYGQRGDKKLTIAFAHGALGQFEPLHRFLNESGWADSWLFCTDGNYQRHRERVPRLVSYKPHGNKLSEPQSFYHLGRIEGAERRSLGLRKAIQEFQQQRRIDLLVAHGTMGSPVLLFEEFAFPIVTYLEFPSFRHHGWDERYPPTEGQQLRDKNFEMLASHCVLKSDRTIVPSDYARGMFAPELRPRIDVLMEGFPLHDNASWSIGGVLQREPGVKYVGFAARDLSSAKGFEQFVRIANRLADERSNIRFVVLGGDRCPYGFEDLFLDHALGKGHGKHFRDWVLDHHQADRSRFIIPGFVDYDTFSRYVNDIDLFLYPLQFGSANWGLFELLGRGRIVIASDRCFVPEVITHDVNGLLCDYNDIDEWVRLALAVLDDPESHRALGETARRLSRRYSIDRVATQFLTICERFPPR